MRSINLVSFNALPDSFQGEYGETFKDEIFLVFLEGQEVKFAYSSPQVAELADQIRDLQVDRNYHGPTAQELAAVAHDIAAANWKLYDQTLEKADKFPFIALARDYDDIAVKFLDGLRVHPILRGEKIIAFKVRGNRGHTYTLSPSGDLCRCDAGLRGRECWHSRAVKTWLVTNRAINERQNTDAD